MTDHHEFFMEMLALIEQDARFAKTHAESYLIGFETEAKSQFQRIWERHGLPALRVELQQAHCLTGYPSTEFTPSAAEMLSTACNPQLHL